METNNLIVTLIGLFVIGLVFWYLWKQKNGVYHAHSTSSGYQLIAINVKGGYKPANIIVQNGKPIKFEFLRQESAPCSEMVIFPDFQTTLTLPMGQKVTIELPPLRAGIYNFTCQMGVYKGKVIVE